MGAIDASLGTVLSTQFEPRYVPVHRRIKKPDCVRVQWYWRAGGSATFSDLLVSSHRSSRLSNLVQGSWEISRPLSVNDAAHIPTRTVQMCHVFLTLKHWRRHLVSLLIVELFALSSPPTNFALSRSSAVSPPMRARSKFSYSRRLLIPSALSLSLLRYWHSLFKKPRLLCALFDRHR